MTWWRRFDPRRQLAAAVGWAVFAVVVLAALLAAHGAASESETRARADTERLLAQFAAQLQGALDARLATRQSVLRATAAQIVTATDRRDAALRRHLEAVQAEFPEFAWLGVAGTDAMVAAATGGALVTTDVSGLPWFQTGQDKAYLGLARGPGPLDALQPAPADHEAPRFVVVAAPVTRASGAVVGVLGGYLSWSWVERVANGLLHTLDVPKHLELLLLDADHEVLIGPPSWRGRRIASAQAVTEGGSYLAGRAESAAGGLGWTVVVRQDARSALAPARATQRLVFVTVLLAGLASAAAAVTLTQLLMRRLGALAAQAQAVQRGELPTLSLAPGRDEVSRIGATLGQLVAHLQREKQALQSLNTELDARVAERTARIERMAEDARHAAVTRERLRLARDLHDTLAHSLMALLTQIRLVRKLRGRLGDSELEAELASAEGVAASGLADARAAITQMRDNGVREVGLGPALHELLARFSERSGVAADLQADAAPANLVDERAETLFRVAEEALRNVERHARAHTVTVQLSENRAPTGAGTLTLAIVDDGIGFDPEAPRPGHFGLHGIREQASLIGATLKLHSRLGEGTRIELTLEA